jgi:hypothetical protein
MRCCSTAASWTPTSPTSWSPCSCSKTWLRSSGCARHVLLRGSVH